jgi:NodT family efflux transporter outer membrane factor (OMF) lipoprotein
LATALALLGACKTAGPNFAPPAAPKTAGYLMQGDAASPIAVMSPKARVAGAWWKAFGSADLDRTVDAALAGSRTLEAANATLERARQQAIAVRGEQLPQADLSASAQRERINLAGFGFKGFPNPTINLYSIGPTVTYDLDLFGGRRRASEQARAQAEAEARRADAAYLTLTGQVTLAALQIATLRDQIVTLDRVIDDDQHVVDLVHRAQEAGGEAAAALSSPKSQLAQDQALRPPLEQQLSQARHNLALLVGHAPGDWTAPDFDIAGFSAPAAVPVSLPSTLVRQRPDILAAEADLHAATANIGIQSAAMYPDVRLSANFLQTAVTPGAILSYGNTGYSIGASLSQPLFHGGTLKANKRAAEAAARASLAQYQQTVLTAFVQVGDVMEAITNDDAELAALARAETAAAANLSDSELAYRLGGGALLSVIDAQRQLSMARRNRAMAAGRRLSDIAQLYVATAADWRDGAAVRP